MKTFITVEIDNLITETMSFNRIAHSIGMDAFTQNRSGTKNKVVKWAIISRKHFVEEYKFKFVKTVIKREN